MAMPVGLPLALVMFAQTASTQPPAPVYGPEAPVTKPPPEPAKDASRECAPESNAPKSVNIIVCAPKSQGYRLDPDLVEARREKKQGDAGRPHNPHESFAVHDCANIGPMGCRGGQTFNVVAAAATAIEIANRLAKGEEIGSLFVVDPQQSEYQLYRAAKARREFTEAEAAVKRKSDDAPAMIP